MTKPKCKLTGADGNIFNLIGLARAVLRTECQDDEAQEMTKRVFRSHSYDEALAIIGEYVEIE